MPEAMGAASPGAGARDDAEEAHHYVADGIDRLPLGLLFGIVGGYLGYTLLGATRFIGGRG